MEFEISVQYSTSDEFRKIPRKFNSLAEVQSVLPNLFEVLLCVAVQIRRINDNG